MSEPELLAQAGPAGTALATDQRFELPPHIALINREIVEAVARAQERRQNRPEILLVEVPPRHGKSSLISENTPAWFLGTFPDLRVILASYEADFAGSWGRKARDLLEEFGIELFGVEVAGGSAARSRWDLAHRKGGMVTAGVGGAITGRGAHLLIIDDPLKNAEQAMSDVVRTKQWQWWLSTARTRLEPGSVVVVLMTRWHADDLGGRMLKASEAGGDPVREIRLPALAGPDDPLGREEGEALWPDRYNRQWLEATRDALGSYWFAALYQGTPVPDEGGVFSRSHFRYFDIEGDQVVLRLPGGDTQTWAASECRKVTYADLAISEKATADYTVASEVWVTPERQMLVRRVTRARIPGPDQPDFFREHVVGTLKVEAIGYQTALLQQLQRAGIPVEPVYPDKDKVTRASAAGALYRAGQVYHLAGAEWLGDFELELLAFPAGEHDDQVDTVAYAARDLASVQTSTRTQRTAGKTITGGLLTREL